MLMIRRVVGDSMRPSLRPGQIVIAWWRAVSVGDIVIASVKGREVIKRVDQLRRGQVYLLGDNALASADSRQYGFLAKTAILGVVMIKLPQSRPAVPLQYKYGAYMGWLAAAIMLGFALLHLFRIDTFIPELDHALAGNRGFAIFAAVAIVMMEVFALPFLLRMRLSPLASFLSGVFGVLVPLVWLLITIWNYTTGISTGQFGEFKSAVVNNWLLLGNVMWLTYAYLTLWALGFDKAYSPALQRIVGKSKRSENKSAKRIDPPVKPAKSSKKAKSTKKSNKTK